INTVLSTVIYNLSLHDALPISLVENLIKTTTEERQTKKLKFKYFKFQSFMYFLIERFFYVVLRTTCACGATCLLVLDFMGYPELGIPPEWVVETSYVVGYSSRVPSGQVVHSTTFSTLVLIKYITY